nr:MAG TPA: hypothetical protein [Caudoviricetes sp.]
MGRVILLLEKFRCRILVGLLSTIFIQEMVTSQLPISSRIKLLMRMDNELLVVGKLHPAV